jgi:hypothetical protein
LNIRRICTILLLLSVQGAAYGESPNDILKRYELSAREENKKFKGFTASDGQDLYFRKGQTSKGELSCSTCHTPDPKAPGRTRANKIIEPLAPVANSMRFTDFRNVEKWFMRNCDDVFHRSCTTQEKGDFITYLFSIQ